MTIQDGADGDEASFSREREGIVRQQGDNPELKRLSVEWVEKAGPKYSYNFNWLGRPIIQLPQDMVSMQELIWDTRPDLIIETGIARGGSLVFTASMLAMLDYCDALNSGEKVLSLEPKRRVLGIDIDIRDHNRRAIEDHAMSNRISMIEGDSTSPEVAEQVKGYAENASLIMVCLDSNHTHEHVLSELRLYAPLVTKGCYCVVLDTLIEDVSQDCIVDRPWGKGNSPKSAVKTYMAETDDFVIDHSIDAKLLLSVAPEGYLKKIK